MDYFYLLWLFISGGYSLVNGLCRAASLKAADFTVIVVFRIVLR